MADFIIRLHKAWRSHDMERSWSNTYEVLSGDPSPLDVDNVALALVAYERRFHLADVNFLEYSISTWAEDSRPYDPTAFVTFGLGATTGMRGVAGDPTALDYNVCFLVKRNTVTGRAGRLYYRGCMVESDVSQAGDGRFELTNPTASGSVGDSFTTEGLPLIAPFLVGGAGPDQLALISQPPDSPGITFRRPIVSLSIGGVTINKHKHRYFDRAP